MSTEIPVFSALRVPVPNAEQQQAIGELEHVLADAGLPNDGVAAYLVPTTEGIASCITRSPEQFGLALSTVPATFEILGQAIALPAGVRAASEDKGPGSPDWQHNNSNCFIVHTEGFHRLVCWKIFQEAGDNDPARSYWLLQLEASGSSKGGRRMDRMWVEARPHEESGRMEFDGIPEPAESIKRENDCRTEQFTLSVTAGSPQIGMSVSWTRTTCEHYEPKQYEDQAHHASIWRGNPDTKTDEVRHVKLLMPVKTADGDLPKWWIPTGQHTTR
jgi:hypothetical protein